MYNVIVMKFSKKNVTKLLNAAYRKKVLQSIPQRWLDQTKASAYAYYTVDSQIISRDKSLQNDKNACYGFSPLNTLCCVKKDGVVDMQLVEFNIVNHFLVKQDGDAAAEVVLCMLAMWLSEDKLKTIRDFDIDTIDLALHNVEQKFLQEAKEAEEKKKKENADTQNKD